MNLYSPRNHIAATVAAVASVAALGAALTNSGCSDSHAANAPLPVAPALPRIVVAIDRSDSTIARRTEQMRHLDLMVGDIDGLHEELDLWAFDTRPFRVWGPNPPDDSQAIGRIKDQEFRSDPAHPRRVTRPALLLQALADDPQTMALKESAPLRLVLFSDGGIDHADDPALMAKAVERLKEQHSDLRILVVGVDAAARPLWDRTLGRRLPADSFKLVTYAEAGSETARTIQP